MEQFYQDKKTKIAIVGAGPAGIYCALNILFEFKINNYDNYLLHVYDKSQALRTLLPTGGGRCNITNSINNIKEFAQNYPRGEKFLYSLFSRHFNQDSLSFFKKINIDTYTQNDGRIFPKSNSAKDVKDKMLSAFNKFKNAKLIHKQINTKEDLKDYTCVIIACGSRKVETLIESFNQPIIPFKRALCALKVKDFKYPKGVSVSSIDGDFIFTNEGISGPLAFKYSSINADKEFPYNISIKLFELEDLLNSIKENPKKSIGNIISSYIPKSLSRAIIEDFDKKAAEISKKKLEEYTHLNLTIIDNSLTGEIVHKGGVDLKYVDKNCKSKINENLWFCGEVLNIDGFCGGFNLQNCWSSANAVANDVVRFIINK